MAVEIERKFKVNGEFKSEAKEAHHIVQGYICSQPERIVRIRISDNEAILTIKGPSDNKGMSRFELNQSVEMKEAEELLKLCEPGMIDKVRHIVLFDNHIWEVDEFRGENEGLIIAEIELSSENEAFALPTWIGDEVTNDCRYYNSMLTKKPYKEWKTK